MNIKLFKSFIKLTSKNSKRLFLLFFLMLISILFDVLSIGSLLPFLNQITDNTNSNSIFLTQINYIKTTFPKQFKKIL